MKRRSQVGRWVLCTVLVAVIFLGVTAVFMHMDNAVSSSSAVWIFGGAVVAIGAGVALAVSAG